MYKIDKRMGRGWAKGSHAFILLSPWCAATGLLLQTRACKWIYTELQWPSVAENKTSIETDGVRSHHVPLTIKKVTGGLCMLEQPTNIWQIHPDSCEIFPLLTSDWLTVFWIRFSIFSPSQTAPYLWYSLDVYRKCSQTWGTAQLLPASFQKSAAPQQMNWNPEQKLCGTKRSRVKFGWMFYFICSYILSSFMKLSNFFHSVTT